jgi:hypothetical protein
MYAGFNGDSCVCTRVSVETVMYVHGLYDMIFWAGEGLYRFVQVDVNRPYRWSATDL